MSPNDKLAKLEIARQLYLFGDPGEDPIKDPVKLASLSGLSQSIIVKHIGVWSTELVAMAQTCHKNFGNVSDHGVVESNNEDIIFLRKQADKIRQQLEETADIQSHTYQQLLTLYNNVTEKWRKLSGVNAALEISARATELAAEAAIKGTIKPAGDTPSRRPTSSVFDMGEEIMEGTVVEQPPKKLA